MAKIEDVLVPAYLPIFLILILSNFNFQTAFSPAPALLDPTGGSGSIDLIPAAVAPTSTKTAVGGGGGGGLLDLF